MEYARSVFSWISESPAAAQTFEESAPSPHLPPPHFLSRVVRKSGRSQAVQTTPTRLTPLESQLKDLVLNLYSDQDSVAVLTRLSESELSEIDSGNVSDQPPTPFSPSHIHSPSPTHLHSSPAHLHSSLENIHTMAQRRMATPLGSYDNTTQPPHREPAALLPSFFSADDNAQVSQDPQLPPLTSTDSSHFQFGVRGAPPSRGTPTANPSTPDSSLPLSISYGPRPPYADPVNISPISSLPVYSHTEFSLSPPTAKKATSDLRSLVSRSFQIVPPQPQKPQPTILLPRAAPNRTQTTPTTPNTPNRTLNHPGGMLATPPASQPHSLKGLPHMQVSTRSTATSTHSPSPSTHSTATSTHSPSPSTHSVPTFRESDDSFGTESAPEVLGTSSTDSDREQLPRAVPAEVRSRDSPDSAVGVSPVPSQRDGSQQPTTQSLPSSDLLRAPSRGGKDEGILPRNPSKELEPDSPLSPKDIRDRLVGMTRQSKQRKGLRSLLPAEKTVKMAEAEGRESLQTVSTSDGIAEDLSSASTGESEESGEDEGGEGEGGEDEGGEGEGGEGEGGEGEDGEGEDVSGEEEWSQGGGDEEGTNLHRFEDVETSSVLSIEQLTESLQTDSPQPLPAHHRDREKTLTPQDDLTTIPLPLLSSPSTPKIAPPPSKYSRNTTVPLPLRMPEHLMPAHKAAAKPRLPFPPGFLSEPTHNPQPKPLPTESAQHSPARSEPRPHTMVTNRIAPPPSMATPQVPSSPIVQLSEALHSKAHLEGQLESVVQECKVLLKERAQLQSKLAVTEMELEEAKREGTGGGGSEGVTLPRSTDPDASRLKEELKSVQRELEREKKALAAVKEDSGRGRLNAQRLQVEIEETRKRAQTQEALVEELRERLQEDTRRLAEEKMAAEEARHQLGSLQGSYQALEDSKVWMQEQLQDALEAKIKLQEDLRNTKASSIAGTFQVDQLARENATFQQQISSLQKGILQDKAKLVSELEAIEADVQSREESYAQLVADRAQLEDLAQRRADEIGKLSTAVAQAQVERDELRDKEAERRRNEEGLAQQCRALQQAKSDAERRLQEAEEELVTKEDDIERLQKLKTGLQERLRQSEAALAKKDGTLQGLRDAQDVLRRELDMVGQARQQVEGELEGERRQVARLEASLKAAEEDGDQDDEGVVRSLTDIQQQLEAENRTLRERLGEKEREVEERGRGVAAMQVQCQDAVAKSRDLLEKFRSVSGECDAMKDSIADKKRTIEQLSREKQASVQEAMSCKTDRDRLQGRLNTALQQKSRLEGQLAEQSSLNELEELQVAVKERAALQGQLDSLKLAQQQELLRAQARHSQMEAELRTAKREAERAQKHAEKALQAKEEALGKMAELKSQTKLGLSELKQVLQGARQEKQTAERDAASLKAELEELRENSQRLEQEAEGMREQLVHESAQKSEVERASGMVALRLKENAEERERELREQNQSLSLELERLKGRLAGITATQQATRSHAGELEVALAQRESSLTKTSAEVQRLLEEKHNVDRQLYTQTSSLEEEVASLKAELTETREQLHTEQARVDGVSEELTQTSDELARVSLGQSVEGRSMLAMTEKISRLSKTRDELRMELSTLRAQLVMAKTATETADRELADKRAQVEILQRNLSISDSQRRQAEGEADELRRRLQRAEETPLSELGEAGESTALEGGGRPGVFETSLSAIGGDEETDDAMPATRDSSASVSSSSHGEREPRTGLSLPPTSPSNLHTAQLREMGQQIERARRQGQEAVEAKRAGEISVLRDQLGSKSRTMSSLQSCLVSLKDDMGRLQHKMHSHSATVRASHHTTKQLESQLADLKRSSSLQSPAFLSDVP